jgi:hypothetical protein
VTQGSIFDDKESPPCGKDLAKAFGPAKALWDELMAHIAERHPQLTHEWKFYGKKHGWQLKYLMKKKKAALYLVPHEGSFLAGMALRPDGVEVVKSSGLPPELIEEIVNGKSYPEGFPARVEVTEHDDLESVKKLLEIKLAT